MLSNAQSPARFGLSSPPKPPPQQPLPSQQQEQLQQPAAPTITTTTSNLLSLLPPLPRSQSLLSQLTSNLFLLSPSPSFRLNPPSFLPQSQNHTPNLNPSPSSAKETLALLSLIQFQLFASVSELQDILDLHDATAAHSRSLSSSLRRPSLSPCPSSSLTRTSGQSSTTTLPSRLLIAQTESPSTMPCPMLIGSATPCSHLLSLVPALPHCVALFLLLPRMSRCEPRSYMFLLI